MMVLDYLSVSFGTYQGETEEINKRLQRRGLDASAIVNILPHIVDSRRCGLIVYYVREPYENDKMVFSEVELNDRLLER